MVHQGSIITAELERDVRATASATAARASGPEWDAPAPVSPARWKRMSRRERAVQLWLRDRGRPNMVPLPVVEPAEGATDAA